MYRGALMKRQLVYLLTSAQVVFDGRFGVPSGSIGMAARGNPSNSSVRAATISEFRLRNGVSV